MRSKNIWKQITNEQIVVDNFNITRSIENDFKIHREFYEWRERHLCK